LASQRALIFFHLNPVYAGGQLLLLAACHCFNQISHRLHQLLADLSVVVHDQ